MSHRFWPLFDLVIKTPRLELRLPSDDDLTRLIALVDRGIHAPDNMPFTNAWTRQPSPQRERAGLQFHWGERANWKPEKWILPLVVIRDGEVIGNQTIGATDFHVRREVETGSWLGQEFQGHGFGKEMRAAVLYLAFEGLGASAAYSDAFDWNVQSIAVSKSLGYEPNGKCLQSVEGKPVMQLNLRIDRQKYESQTREMYQCSLDGLDGCLDMFEPTRNGMAKT